MPWPIAGAGPSISVWTVLLLAIGLGAGAFMGKLSNTFAIPGTETQRTLDRMKVEMPELAGGTGVDRLPLCQRPRADGRPAPGHRRLAG